MGPKNLDLQNLAELEVIELHSSVRNARWHCYFLLKDAEVGSEKIDALHSVIFASLVAGIAAQAVDRQALLDWFDLLCEQTLGSRHNASFFSLAAPVVRSNLQDSWIVARLQYVGLPELVARW